jgi:RND superfamily putative drug exporter
VILLVGMAVGVDYSLFYVRREREERARGASPRSALDRAAETAGHAVVVSGISVVVAMAGMFLSGSAVFRSFGLGTILVVTVTVAGALTALPALLATLGDRIDSPRLPFARLVHRSRRRPAHAPGESRLWTSLLRPVLRFPRSAFAVAALALIGLALPVLGMRLATPGEDTLPQSIPVVQSLNRLHEAFPGNGDDVHEVVLYAPAGARLDRAAATAGLRKLADSARDTAGFAVPHGVKPDFSTDGRVARLDLPITAVSGSQAAEDTVTVLRSRLAPAALDGVPGSSWAVTGPTAGSMDFDAGMVSSLPLVLTFVLGLTFLVLTLSFRAPIVAAVSVALNMLSVGAAYGALVLVFQHTWAEDLLGFHSNGAVVAWLPLFALVILFGLSTDYTVLVVSRIREAVDRGLSTSAAVREGILRTAGVVTSAAVIMVAVFAIFATLTLMEFKQMGVGLAVAVLIDATVVRAVLLPAALAALGERAWAAPRWLRRRPPVDAVAPQRELAGV